MNNHLRPIFHLKNKGLCNEWPLDKHFIENEYNTFEMFIS